MWRKNDKHEVCVSAGATSPRAISSCLWKLSDGGIPGDHYLDHLDHLDFLDFLDFLDEEHRIVEGCHLDLDNVL